MSAPFTSRRRAEELDALLEGRARLSPEAEQRHAELLSVVAGLRELPQPTPRPEFVASLRDQLMAEAETALVPVEGERAAGPERRLPARDPRRARRDRRVAALLGAAALVGGTGSVAVASQAALPGEVLYPVKQALESAHSGVTTGDQDQGFLLLSRAELRLDEVESLVERDDAESRRATPGTLEAFTSQAREGAGLLIDDYESQGREGSVTRVRDFAAEGLARLETLSGQVPADATDELVTAAEALLEIDAAAREACPDCGDAGLTEVPHFLASRGEATPQEAEVSTGVRARGPKQVKGPGPTSTGQPPAPATPLPPVPGVPGDPKVPAPTPTGPLDPRVPPPGPIEPTETTVIDKVTETLLGNPTPSVGGTPSTGIVGGLNETLGGVTETLLGQPAGETVEQTGESVRELLGGVVGQLPDQR